MRSVKPNSRVLWATVILLSCLTLYAAAAVTLADYLPAHGLVQGVYIAAAGLVWVWPAVSLTRWASRRA